MREKIYPIDTTFSDVFNKKCPILCAMDVIGSKMESDRIIMRCELISAPPKVIEYSLTDFGRELIPALNKLYICGEKILLNGKNR